MQHDDLVSVAEAARKTGRNRSTIHRQIKSGQLRSYGKKVRLTEIVEDRAANIDTTRSQRRAGAIDDIANQADATPGATTDATKLYDATATAGDPPVVVRHADRLPYKEARELKETALARLRQLEYDLKSGEVVPIDVVIFEVNKQTRGVRDQFLAMPSSLAPRLVGKRTGEIEALIRDELYRILENLSSGADLAEHGRKAGMAQ